MVNEKNSRGISTSIVIALPRGLHARPSAKFAQLAQSFKSDIELINENGEVNAKSMLDVLSLNIKKGEEITILANGPDASEALDKLSAFCLDEQDWYGKEDS